MAEALEAVYPRTTLQTCIVHLLRNSLSYAGYRERKALADALADLPGGERRGSAGGAGGVCRREWGQRFPTVAAVMATGVEQVIPFFAFPPEVRRVIYTTNAIESPNARVRKIIKTRGTSRRTRPPPS